MNALTGAIDTGTRLLAEVQEQHIAHVLCKHGEAVLNLYDVRPEAPVTIKEQLCTRRDQADRAQRIARFDATPARDLSDVSAGALIQ
jgi:hypothetical protein